MTGQYGADDAPQGVGSPCEIVRTDLHGWSAIVLRNELVSVTAVPLIGGRVMSFKLGAREYLFTNPALAGRTFTAAEHRGDGSLASWKNYGGEKTWPAPQGWGGPNEWPGPPDPILDSGPYQAMPSLCDQTASLTMSSPSDPATGLRIHRHLVVQPGVSRVVIEQTLENVKDHPVSWAPWDVLQLDCGRLSPDGGREPDDACWLYIPFDSHARDVRPYRVMFGQDHPQWQQVLSPGLLGVQYRGIVGKIGLVNTAGWVAFASQTDGYVLCARFAVDPNAEYPDDGSTVECWTESPVAKTPPGLTYQSAGYVMEAEVLGPLRTLQPGQRNSLTVEWCLARCDGPIVGVNRAGCIHVPLRIMADGGRARVNGQFGCFDIGEVEFVWLDADQNELERHTVQPASPISMLTLDSVYRIPDRAVRGRVEIRRVYDNDRNRIDETIIS